MELTARRPLDGWTVVTAVVAVLIAAPLLALPLAFAVDPGGLGRYSSLLPDAVVATLALIAGVAAGTFLLGTALAVLVCFYDFPGRRWMEWALALPLAMPGYVFTLFTLGTAGAAFPGVRSIWGAIAVFTLVLYPYVYLLARSAFNAQSRNLFEAARALGHSRRQSITRVALPLARPAILGGVAIAVMEALADFGTVNLLGVHTFTDAIYRVWFNAFDREAAMQFALLLVSLTLTLLFVARLTQGRARYYDELRGGESAGRVRLSGSRGLVAMLAPLTVIGIVVAAPLTQLTVWAAQAVDRGVLSPQFGPAARNTLLFGLFSGFLVASVGVLLAYGRRQARSPRVTAAVRVATIGYGVPGSVVAVAVFAPLAFIDRRVDDLGDAAGLDVGLLLTGTALALFAAYLVRFAAVAFQAIDATLERVPPSLDEAARGLGVRGLEVLARVHLPLMRAGVITAGLLVFAETVKELPATMLLRPVGGDTLAIEVWQATTESRWETAALPALMIVLIGLVPMALLIRASRRR